LKSRKKTVLCAAAGGRKGQKKNGSHGSSVKREGDEIREEKKKGVRSASKNKKKRAHLDEKRKGRDGVSSARSRKKVRLPRGPERLNEKKSATVFAPQKK